MQMSNDDSTQEQKLQELSEHLSGFKLGETPDTIEVDTSTALRMIVQHMTMQATRSINIFTRQLDAMLYDNQPFIDALTALARHSKYATIQILAQDSMPAVKNGHRLIQLGQQLSSYVQIRKVHNDYRNYNHAFLVADAKGVIFREFADRYEAEIDYNKPVRARELFDFFSSVWASSEPDPQVRRLNI